MRRHLAYLKYVLRHKWFVFVECLKLGVPIWIAILHDWDKFLPDEFLPYARFFHNPDGTPVQRRDGTGYYKPTDTGNEAFERAWFLHAKRNKHHWQYWVMPTEGKNKIYPMPEVFRREMLADWRGAGRAQGTPDTQMWYARNAEKMQLDPSTRHWIEVTLFGLAFWEPELKAANEAAEIEGWTVQTRHEAALHRRRSLELRAKIHGETVSQDTILAFVKEVSEEA